MTDYDPRLGVILTHWPYAVAEHHMGAYQYRMLRLHGQWVVTGGKDMTAEELEELRGFHEEVADKVILFDPRAGWSYRPRVQSDEDLLIGANEHTTITEDGAEIWQLPPGMRS